jgi:hypothetical protein
MSEPCNKIAREKILALRSRIENLERTRVKHPELVSITTRISELKRKFENIVEEQARIGDEVRKIQLLMDDKNKVEENKAGIPAIVVDLESLKQFICAEPELGKDWALQYRNGGDGPDSNRRAAAKIRDLLARRYPAIERLNDWTWEARRYLQHSDTFFYSDSRLWVDFVKDSTGSGVIWNKLQFQLNSQVGDDVAFSKQRDVTMQEAEI